MLNNYEIQSQQRLQGPHGYVPYCKAVSYEVQGVIDFTAKGEDVPLVD